MAEPRVKKQESRQKIKEGEKVFGNRYSVTGNWSLVIGNR